MRADEDKQGIRLTAEEALSLLDLILFSPVELSDERQRLLMKLSAFCREFLQNEEKTVFNQTAK